MAMEAFQQEQKWQPAAQAELARAEVWRLGCSPRASAFAALDAAVAATRPARAMQRKASERADSLAESERADSQPASSSVTISG